MHGLGLPLQVKLESIAIIARLSGGGDPIVQRIMEVLTAAQMQRYRTRN